MAFGILRSLSLNARGARYHIGIAMALITVLPSMALLYLIVVEADASLDALWRRPVVLMILFGSMGLGYSLLSRYPANIIRLRKYLQDMVNGRFPDKVELLEGMDDIPAIEQSLTMLVEQFSRQVSRMENEFRRIEWLMNRHVTPAFWKSSPGQGKNVAPLSAPRNRPPGFILKSVGEEMLREIIGDLVDLMETSAVCFEANGDTACHFVVSAWCRCLEEQRPGGESHCLSALWRDGANSCLKTGLPNDMECPCGIRAFIVPVEAGGKAVGAVAFSYGDPPRDPAKLKAVADHFHVPPDLLRFKAKEYETRPPFIVNVARNRLLTSAKLIGQIIDRRQAEEVLRNSEEHLRHHRDHLEELVGERTAELQTTNELLGREVEERRKAERLKDEFISTVSHELRTPLAITKEGISLLLDGIPGAITDKQQRVLQTARNNIDRLARIINDLLDISKIEAGKMDIRRAPLDLAGLIRQAVAALEPLALQKKIGLEADLPEGPLQVFADADRIMQVLTNLIGNAIKFTSEGSVRVSAGGRKQVVECAVQDTGAGIAAEDLPRLFQKFVQLRRMEGAGERGTGLGLVIAKKIVELHRGHIWAESQPGKGTTFTFTVERFIPETLLREAVESQLHQAREAQKEMLFCLFAVEAPGRGAAAQAAGFSKGALSRHLQAAALVRSSDLLIMRGDRQFIMAAACRGDEKESILRHWTERVAESLLELDRSLRLRQASAIYPSDGFSADELLKKAENELAGTGEN